MFLRKTVRKYKDRAYTNYLLVETISTPRGPRQRTICSLGDLSPGLKPKWPGLVGQVEAALSGQRPLGEQEPLVEGIVEKIRQAGRGCASPADGVVAVRSEEVSLENARGAGPVHVGHPMWHRLGLEP